MTEQHHSTPRPAHAMLIDDNGEPIGVMDLDRMQSDAIELAYEMAMYCDDETTLDTISEKWLNRVGVDAFGYVAAGALRMMTHYILDPTLQTVDKLAPQLRFRDKLVDAYRNSKETR